jgi:hypothetical protein
MGFLPVLPGNSGFSPSSERGTLGKRPGHSHSIVSETPKQLLFRLTEYFRPPQFTVRFTVKQSRLKAIDGDRCRSVEVLWL